jgi:hypothetical protein
VNKLTLGDHSENLEPHERTAKNVLQAQFYCDDSVARLAISMAVLNKGLPSTLPAVVPILLLPNSH